jgi:hypothetical protein
VRTYSDLTRDRLNSGSLLVVDFAAAQARSPKMDHLSATHEELLIEAEDCDLIGRLATDLNTRELFYRLALDLRTVAHELEIMILARVPVIF